MAMMNLQIGAYLADYEIVELIGRGGMGSVYRVRDREGDEWALKVLALDELGDLREAERFEREALMVQDLKHEHIVDVHATGRVQGFLYMAMELVEGVSLREVLRREKKLEMRRAVGLASQVAAALHCAHMHGVVHRDIKAENILLRADGRIKVLDFGVASMEGTSALTRANEIVGTVEYMAPEQILGEPVRPATDLYALGVLLYEMLVGALPFAAETPATLVYHQLNEEARPPSYANPLVPQAIDQLVLRLLDKEMENRPPSALVVQETLEGIDRRLEIFDVLIPVADEAGKTRAIEEFCSYVLARGGRCASGTCFYEHGMGPYMPLLAAVDEVLGGAMDAAERAQLIALIAERVPELVPLLETSSTVAKVHGGFSIEDAPEAGRQRLYEGLIEVLVACAKERPLVLVLEDIHWADEGTLHFMSYLMRRCGEVALFCVATYRSEEIAGDGQGPLAGLMVQWANEDLFCELRIGSLDARAVLQLARSLFLQTNFSDDFGLYLYEQSEGNPFVVIEVLKLLRQRQILYCENGVWAVRAGFGEDLVPDRVGALIMHRIEQLDDEHRDLLDLAAVIGISFSSALLEKASNLGRIELLKTLYRLERRYRLIESTETGYRFVHSKVREVLYEEVPPELRTEYHRVIVAALKSAPDKSAGIGDEELSRHLFFAGQWDEALVLLRRCGEHALSTFSWRLAVDFFAKAEIACQHSGADVAAQMAVLRCAAEAWKNLGAWQEADKQYERQYALALEEGFDEVIVQALISRGRIREIEGKIEEAERMYQQALERAEALQNATLQARVLLNIGGLEFELGQYDSAAERWGLALELLPEEAVSDRADAFNNLAVLATMRGQVNEAWSFYERALESDGTEKIKTIQTYQNMGMLRADEERWDEALALYDRALRCCEQMRVTLYLSDIYLNRSEALIGKGDLAAARLECSRALRGYRHVADGLGMADALRFYGQIYRVEQSWEDARKCLQKSLDILRPHGPTVSLGEVLCEVGALECDMGQSQAALEPLREAERIFADAGAVPDLERVRERMVAISAA
jgi:tetratricopeptide (TPR) repeat protein